MIIVFLKEVGFMCSGDVADIIHEDDTAYYYYDCCDRWCYINKSEEDEFYIIQPITLEQYEEE